jgi:hypothetical protein
LFQPQFITAEESRMAGRTSQALQKKINFNSSTQPKPRINPGWSTA